MAISDCLDAAAGHFGGVLPIGAGFSAERLLPGTCYIKSGLGMLRPAVGCAAWT